MRTDLTDMVPIEGPSTGNSESCKAKLPYNNHYSNMITLHRVKDFRSLALDLKPDFESSARDNEIKNAKTVPTKRMEELQE